MIHDLLRLAGALLMLAGTFYTLAAAIGIVRLPDLFTRMHASSKAGAVGAGLMLLAAALAGGEWPLAGRAIAGFIFLIFTTPVAAHLLARAAVISGQSPGREGMRRKKARGAEKARI